MVTKSSRGKCAFHALLVTSQHSPVHLRSRRRTSLAGSPSPLLLWHNFLPPLQPLGLPLGLPQSPGTQLCLFGPLRSVILLSHVLSPSVLQAMPLPQQRGEKPIAGGSVQTLLATTTIPSWKYEDWRPTCQAWTRGFPPQQALQVMRIIIIIVIIILRVSPY